MTHPRTEYTFFTDIASADVNYTTTYIITDTPRVSGDIFSSTTAATAYVIPSWVGTQKWHHDHNLYCHALNITFSLTELRAYKVCGCDLRFLQTMFIGDMLFWQDVIKSLWNDPFSYTFYFTYEIPNEWLEVFRWVFSKVLPKVV